MSDYDSTYGSGAQNVAGIFIDRESAHDALTELHHAGFRRVWLGVTRAEAGETTIEAENAGGFMEQMGRFFSGEDSRGQALHAALTAHGLTDEQARGIDAQIAPGNAIIIVDGENDVVEATDIIEETGGKLAAAALAAPRATSLGARSADTAADARRLELREERLSIDKQRVQSGEAQIGKRVVTQQQSVDVPVFHEELYIERRPASGTAAATQTPIGEGEVIHVPLMAERVDVSKRTVVNEEVVIGKRRIEGTERVSDSVRREELVVESDSRTDR
jgi:uncharacterized protein (TIGR02271 family)